MWLFYSKQVTTTESGEKAVWLGGMNEENWINLNLVDSIDDGLDGNGSIHWSI